MFIGSSGVMGSGHSMLEMGVGLLVVAALLFGSGLAVGYLVGRRR